MKTNAVLQCRDIYFSPTLCGQSRDIDPDESRLTLNGWTHTGQSMLATDVEEDIVGTAVHHDAFGRRSTPGRQPGQMFRENLDESTNAFSSFHHITAPYSRPRAHTNLKSEEDRLSSFAHWRHQEIVRKEDLARNGFVCTGSGDKVRCVYCNILLHHWAPEDVVEQEHQRNSSRCPFLQGEDVGNIPLESAPSQRPQDAGEESWPWTSNTESSCGSRAQGQGHTHGASASQQATGHGSAVAGTSSAAEKSSQSSKHMCSSSPRNPRMAVEVDRLATFRSWPSQMTQKPEQMAHCGLYYTGDGDKVKCFHCDIGLYNWEPSDDPFKEHARWFPDCEYLRLVKGDRFAEDVKSNRPTEEDQMESPAVQAVLFTGYSQHTIKKALDVLRGKSVQGDGVSAEILLKTILEMEEPVTGSAGHSSSEEQSGEFHALQRLHESLLEKQQCKICMERDVEVIFFPCKHFVCCAACGSSVTTCPICREPIQSRDKVYMA